MYSWQEFVSCLLHIQTNTFTASKIYSIRCVTNFVHTNKKKIKLSKRARKREAVEKKWLHIFCCFSCLYFFVLSGFGWFAISIFFFFIFMNCYYSCAFRQHQKQSTAKRKKNISQKTLQHISKVFEFVKQYCSSLYMLYLCSAFDAKRKKLNK